LINGREIIHGILQHKSWFVEKLNTGSIQTED